MGKKEISCFLCRELLYEYATNVIGDRRRLEVSEHVESCAECRSELDSLQKCLAYLSQLSRIEIKSDFLQSLVEPEPLLKQWLKKIGWQKWPDPIKWTIESVLVGTVLVVFIGLISQKIIFRSPDKTETLYTQTSDAVEVTKDTEVSEVPAEQLQGSENGENPFSGTDADMPEQSSAPVASAPVTTAVQPPVKTAVEAKPAPEPVEAPKTLGFVYRGNISVKNIKEVTPALVDKIKSLGGQRAGEVELGWRQPNGSYFHFSISEANLQDIMAFLKSSGELKLVKEKNSRVMPVGTVRVILNLNGVRDESGPVEPTESSTPLAEDPPASGEDGGDQE
jgi:hypothetical protein